MKLSRRLLIAAAMAVPLLLALLAGGSVLLMRQGGLEPFRVPAGGSTPLAATPRTLERGRYLATLGNCAGCHTAPGGARHAGGRAFRTAYGTVYSSNITPDVRHGIGDWSSAEFRHAMRHGVSRNGVLSPVFPYANFRHLTDGDLDALLAFLRTQPAAEAERRRADFAFPANLPGAMLGWRLLYYRPAAALPAEDRGRYLVEGIGHCTICHGARGTFGSQDGGHGLRGATNAGWYAPPLHEASLARFAPGEIAHYLRGGAPQAAGAYGRMADVVAGNLQHLTPADAMAIEASLRALPAPRATRPPPLQRRASGDSLQEGRELYAQHCADCHGDEGQGEAGKYPALSRSSAVSADDPINLVKLVLFGAVAPSTPLNPRPYTMPGFAQTLTAAQIADLANYLRLQGDREAEAVTVEDVQAMSGL